MRKQYAKLADVVPKDQYYRFHDQWRYITQRLCFLASLVVYLEVKVLVTKETVAEILGGEFLSFIFRREIKYENNIFVFFSSSKKQQGGRVPIGPGRLSYGFASAVRRTGNKN